MSLHVKVIFGACGVEENRLKINLIYLFFNVTSTRKFKIVPQCSCGWHYILHMSSAGLEERSTGSLVRPEGTPGPSTAKSFALSLHRIMLRADDHIFPL